MFFLVPISIMENVDAQIKFKLVPFKLSERPGAPYGPFLCPRANFRKTTSALDVNTFKQP